MSLAEQLKVIRTSEKLSQEDMAEKLGYSNNGYAKVERGESTPRKKRLKKISEILGTDLETLVDSETNHTVNIKGNNHHYHNHSVILLSETECAHELEKARLLLQERDKEIEYLKKMITLLENADKSQLE